MHVLKAIIAFLPTALRLLIGALLIHGGSFWIGRADAAAFLTDAINTAIDGGQTFGFYQPFLRRVVLPNADLFAGLVGWGELMSGISIGSGFAVRLGASVIAFQFLNYGLLGGPMGILSHGIMTALVAIPVVFHSGRRFGVDRWLYGRWPKARVW